MWDGLAALMMTLAGLGSTWLVQATVLLALGLLAGQLLRRSGPAVLSGIYRTTLAAILICPVASAVLIGAGVDGLALRWPGPVHEPATAPRPPAVSRPVVVAREPDRRDVLLDRGDRPLERAPRAREEEAPAIAAKPMPPTPRPSPRLTRVAAVAVGFAVWGLGATIIGLRLWVGLIRMRRLRGSAVPAEPDAAALCRDVARRMNVGAPTVWRSPFLFSPCLDGLRRPAILLPDDVDGNLMDIFVHELAHLVRRDGFWNLLRRSAAVALWVHPLFWVLTRRLEAAAEEVCDDYVVQFGADRARYAGHLLELAGRALPPVAPAGVGMISLRSMLARRIVRILDTSRTLSTRAGTRAVLGMLAVGLVGTVFAGLLGVAGGERKAKAQDQGSKQVTEAHPASQVETIRGQVVGPNGEPVPGATVIASRSRPIPHDGIGDEHKTNRPYERVRRIADQAGRFEISFARSRTDPEEVWSDDGTIATAPGFGLGCLLDGKPIRLTAGDQPINGRLVDLEGRPMPGIHVRLVQAAIPAPGIVEGTPSQSKPWSFEGRLGVNATALMPDGVVTDADGRFRVEGLGRDALATLTFTGPTIASKRAKIVTRIMEPVADKPRDPDLAGLDDPVTYGADCTIIVEATRPIEGFVRDAETKEPIAGAVVTAAELSNSKLTIDGLISAETDAQGHYRLVGLPKERGKGHKLSVYPPLDRPYFITRRIEVPARPGIDPVTHDISLKRGVWITGIVTDLSTGRPVPAALDYFPLLSNPNAKHYPNFNANVTASLGVKSRYKNDNQGRFRIVALPGGGVVTARSDDPSFRVGVGAESIKGRIGRDQLLTYDRIFTWLYQGFKEVEVPEGAASFTCDLGLDRGRRVRVRLIDTAGAPVADARVTGQFPEGGDLNAVPPPKRKGKASVIEVGGLEPDKPRTLVIQHRTRKIGAVLKVSPDGPSGDVEMTVTLRPYATITGRLVDEKGRPAVGGVQVRLLRGGAPVLKEAHITDARLDAEGRFHCEELPPGGPYLIRGANRLDYGIGRREPEQFRSFEVARDLNIKEGEVVDLGTFNVTTGKPIEPPPTKSAQADVPINGRIVDLEGRPVAGVTVKVGNVQGAKSADLSPWIEGVRNGEPPWIAYRHTDEAIKLPENVRLEVATDADGRFRLEGLGGERVAELTIHGDAVAYTTIEVITRKIDPFPARGFPDTHGPGTQTIYGADFTFTTAPSRPVEGVVRDARTKQPMAGVTVESSRFAGSDFVEVRPLKSVTDERGRFRIVGMPKGKGNLILAVPNDDQPYFMRRATVGDPPGIAPVTVEIELHRGVMIAGKITDKATGKPVADARLHYLPFLENPYVQSLPEFDKNGNVDGYQRRYTTKADGTYRLVGMPGRAIVGVEGVGKSRYRTGAGAESISGVGKNGDYETWNNPIQPSRSWPNTLVEINPAEGTEDLTLDAQLDPGLSLRIKVVDSEGKPVPDASVVQRNQLPIGVGGQDALFELANFRPDEVRLVVIRHDGRKLGKVVRLRPGDDAKGPVVVTLAPMASIKGRIADADGNPVPAARVRVDLEMTDTFIHPLTNVISDRDGRFEVLNVPTGSKYGLVVESGGMIKERRVASGKAVVKPGETTDVEDIAFKND